jgi:hypothetical protein
VTVTDVKQSHEVHRLWKDGASGNEYFLVENRQQDRYDAELPGGGLLIYHVDDSISSNSDETHYKVGLEQADGDQDLENAANRGDDGDPYPGSSGNRSFNKSSTPDSTSYNDVDTCVAVTNISDPSPAMTARFSVRCGKFVKEFRKDKEFHKERGKEFKSEIKEPIKEGGKEIKERGKEIKEKDDKEIKEIKEGGKEIKEIKEGEKGKWEKGFQPDKRPEKPDIDKSERLDKNPITEGKNRFTEGKDLTEGKDRLEGKLTDGKFTEGKFTEGKLAEGGFGRTGGEEYADLRARVDALERRFASPEPFIDRDLRPDLSRGALAAEDDVDEATKRMAEGDRAAKRNYDTKLRDRDR